MQIRRQIGDFNFHFLTIFCDGFLAKQKWSIACILSQSNFFAFLINFLLLWLGTPSFLTWFKMDSNADWKSLKLKE